MDDTLSRLKSGLATSYLIERELGRGGMATVYLARELRHDRVVALKVLIPELASVVGVDRFLREIEIAARLRHPNVIPLLESGEFEGLLYYTMPVVEGESLRDKLRREKQLPISEAVQIARQVADALAYSHRNGVIHRDIKPSNIMLDSGHAVVADFGIALLAKEFAADRLTASGFSPGSPEYMSPEQASGEHDLDARSDVYSLACVVFEMLTGDPPFTGSIPQAILAKKLMQAVPHLRVVRDTVPEHLDWAVTVGLAKSPADRFATAEEFRRALDGDIDPGRAIQAESSPPETRDKGVTNTRLAGLVAGALAGAGVLLSLIGFLTTRVYDLKLGIPLEHTPSRTDFIVVGAKALVPPIIFFFTAVVAYVGLKFVWRAFSAGLHKVPAVDHTMETLQVRTTEAWRSLWRTAEAGTVADAYFIGGIVVSVVVLSLFRPLLGAVWSDDSEVLACSFREMHQAYVFTTAVLTGGLALAWVKFARYLAARRIGGARVATGKWGGLVWVIIVAMVMTLPWRLVWDNERPRVLWDGEPAYILVETEIDLVLYNPRTQVTERLLRGQEEGLERLGTSGYVFEDPESFTSPRSGC
jgi:serine/threonine protein kinase